MFFFSSSINRRVLENFQLQWNFGFSPNKLTNLSIITLGLAPLRITFFFVIPQQIEITFKEKYYLRCPNIFII